MSWITDNKPAAILTFVGLAGIMGIGYYGYTLTEEIAKVNQSIDDKGTQLSSWANAQYPPNATVRDGLQKQIIAYEAEEKKLDTSYTAYQATCDAMEQVTPEGFQNALREEMTKLTGVCTQKGIKLGKEKDNEAEWMGFAQYVATPPSSTMAPLLNFQRESMVFAVNALVNSDAKMIRRIIRTNKLVGESTAVANKDKAPAAKPPTMKPSTWVPMTFEIVFEGTRGSVRSFLNSILKSDKYLYTVNTIRVQNSDVKLDKLAQALKATKVEGGTAKATSSGILVVDETKKDDATPAAPTAILRKVLGEETINVHISLNLMYWVPAPPKAGSKK